MAKRTESFWLTPKGFAAIGLIGAASYFLFMEHRQHLFEFLPFLILLACPLMHIFMHGGHGGHEHQENETNKEALEDEYRGGLEDGKKKPNQQHHDQ